MGTNKRGPMVQGRMKRGRFISAPNHCTLVYNHCLLADVHCVYTVHNVQRYLTGPGLSPAAPRPGQQEEKDCARVAGPRATKCT
jgi:hypothetical protein